jgi:hypothetical protein
MVLCVLRIKVPDWKSQTGSLVRDTSFVETKLSPKSKSHSDVTISLTKFCIAPMGLTSCAETLFATNISSPNGIPKWDFNTKNV